MQNYVVSKIREAHDKLPRSSKVVSDVSFSKLVVLVNKI